jgi:hypothetical protein
VFDDVLRCEAIDAQDRIFAHHATATAAPASPARRTGRFVTPTIGWGSDIILIETRQFRAFIQTALIFVKGHREVSPNLGLDHRRFIPIRLPIVSPRIARRALGIFILATVVVTRSRFAIASIVITRSLIAIAAVAAMPPLFRRSSARPVVATTAA